MKVSIFNKTEERFFRNDDGEKLLFDSETEAKNFLFGLGFTYEFVKANIEFKPIYKT